MKFLKMKYAVWFCLLAARLAYATDPIYTPWHSNLAVKGYDTVAYFTQQAAVKGLEAYSYDWQGVTWQFSNEENLALFKTAPEQYAPQFGGYCAYAVANDSLAGIDPTQFTVLNGKLYLNYNEKIQRKWLANRDDFIANAHKNWPSLINK